MESVLAECRVMGGLTVQTFESGQTRTKTVENNCNLPLCKNCFILFHAK